MDLTGVILCGGRSSRMGEDKGLVKHKGKHLIEYPLLILNQLTDKVYLSTSNQDYLVFGYPLIKDEIRDIGPIGGIYSSMKLLNSENYFFISCDTPNVTVQIAKIILEHAHEHDIVVPKTLDGQIHPLFGYYSKRAFRFIKNQIDRHHYKMLDLLRKSNTLCLDISESGQKKGSKILQNINSKKDVR